LFVGGPDDGIEPRVPEQPASLGLLWYGDGNGDGDDDYNDDDDDDDDEGEEGEEEEEDINLDTLFF
jgi:hypothetical protein